MRWSNGNTPTFTLSELVELAKSTLGSSAGESDVADAVQDALLFVAPRLKSLFHVTTPVQCVGVCEIDLSALGVTEVVNVQFKAPGCLGPTCWADLPWWDMVGTLLQVSPVQSGSLLRISFLEPAPVWLLGNHFTVRELQSDKSSEGDLVLMFPDAAGAKEPGRVPTAGHIRLTDGRTYEYVGRTVYEDAGETFLVLHNVERPGWVGQGEPALEGEQAQFVVPIRDARLLEAIRAAVQASYWMRRVSTCIGDEDKGFASQMLVFFSGERDKRWKDLRGMKPQYRERLKWRNENARVMQGCC